MLRFAICEDDPVAREALISYIKDISLRHYLDAHVVFYSDNPQRFLTYVRENVVDAIFMDIGFEERTDGLRIVEQIRKFNKKVHIIFTTALFEYAFLSFNLNTFDYIIKPIEYKHLEKTLISLNQHVADIAPSFISIKSCGTTHLVEKKDIYYIEKIANKAYTYTEYEVVESNHSLDEFEKMLDSNFIRCHKSYIINLPYVRQVDYVNNTVELTKGNKCFIGRSFKNNFSEVLKQHGYV